MGLEDWKKSGISRKFPTYRNSQIVSIERWLDGKRKDDGAEGLWRIKDGLYDFTDFIDRHPGGAFWLEQTRGTDITEPFESHHISQLPEKMLSKFKIRDAKEPRNYLFTMHENGFYRTLKKRVREKLETMDTKPKRNTSNALHFLLLAATFIFAYISVKTENMLFEILTSLALCWLAIATHNYFHRKDNWQMYAFNLTFLNFANWRISHALSHHVYPNSLHDLEMSLFEPFLCWVPNIHFASKMQRIISLFIQPIFYSAIYLFSFIMRVITSLVKRNIMYWHDVIGFTLPLMMITVSDQPVFATLRQYLFMNALSSFIFALIGLNAAHHDPHIHHDGDANRKDLDWGLFQIDTIIDRGDIKGSQFLILTHFGEHALHHLFPTLDHGILPELNPILLETLKEFNGELRETNQLGHIIGQNKQLLRIVPNPIAPDRRHIKSR